MVLVSVYGFSVALSTSLNTQILEKNDCVEARPSNDQVLAYGLHYSKPMGDPIDDPIPNPIVK